MKDSSDSGNKGVSSGLEMIQGSQEHDTRQKKTPIELSQFYLRRNVSHLGLSPPRGPEVSCHKNPSLPLSDPIPSYLSGL